MKNRESKHLSACQRLARELDSPSAKTKRKKRKRAPLSPILDLPAEIRQQILSGAIDDDELLTAPLEDAAINLSKVCQAFSEDVTWVSGRWAQRRVELRAEHRRVFGGFIKDLLTSNGLTLGKLAPSQSVEISSHHEVAADEGRVETGLRVRPLDDRPFSFLDKWRKKRLRDARRAEKAFSAGNFEKGRKVRRMAGSERKKMKFDRLTFLPPGEREKSEEKDEYLGELNKAAPGSDEGTSGWYDSTAEQTSKEKEVLKRRKKNRSDKLSKKAHETWKQRLKHDRLVDEGQIMQSPERFLGSARTRPEGMSRKDYKAHQRAAKWAKRVNHRRVDAMEEEWAIKNRGAAERRDVRLRLRAAYGDYKGLVL